MYAYPVEGTEPLPLKVTFTTASFAPAAISGFQALYAASFFERALNRAAPAEIPIFGLVETVAVGLEAAAVCVEAAVCAAAAFLDIPLPKEVPVVKSKKFEGSTGPLT